MSDSGSNRGFSLKDELFNPDRVAYLAQLLDGAKPGFDAERFQREVMARLGQLELKQRINWIAEVLAQYLPDDFDEAAATIEAALPPPLDPTLTDDDFGDFIFAPFGAFVAANGVDHFDRSMECLRQITMRFSMEDAVRVFLRADPDRALDVADRWADDENYHVRRLVSEGTRPRLPWSGRLSLPLERVIPLLDRLQGDPTRYVTRSVANHLNDLAKDDPAVVLDALGRWRAASSQDGEELEWITRHALRTLIKAGHRDTMTFLGYRPDPPVEAALSVENEVVTIGDTLRFTVDVAASGPARLIVDYVIGFRKANGEKAPKTFKLKTFELSAGERRRLTKNHRLMAAATTYKLYPGRHSLTIQINGAEGPTVAFDLQ